MYIQCVYRVASIRSALHAHTKISATITSFASFMTWDTLYKPGTYDVSSACDERYNKLGIIFRALYFVVREPRSVTCVSECTIIFHIHTCIHTFLRRSEGRIIRVLGVSRDAWSEGRLIIFFSCTYKPHSDNSTIYIFFRCILPDVRFHPNACNT